MKLDVLIIIRVYRWDVFTDGTYMNISYCLNVEVQQGHLGFQEAGVPTGAITGIMHYLEKAKKKASECEALHMIHCNPIITLYVQYCP